MLTALSEIHFWTTQDHITIKNTDYGSHKYHSKKDTNSCLYAIAKKQYVERNGNIHLPNNSRPDKLRDRLKELEEYLIHSKVIFYYWSGDKLKLLLSTGIIIHLTINYRTGDLVNIVFDKQLTLKLQANIISDGILFDSNVICASHDGHVFGYGPLWKDGWILEGGPTRRHLHQYGDWLVVYSKTSMEHPQPWSPLIKDHQRANLHLYGIGGGGDPELLAYRKTEVGEPLLVIISKIYTRTIIVIEQKVTQKGAVSVEISTFELMTYNSNNNLKRTSITSVPLQTQVSCCALSENEERLIMGCIDGSLALLDRNRGTTRTVKATFIPTLTTWHPDGVVVVITNERGQLQYYDTALNTIKIQLTNEDECISTNLFDLTGYFKNQFNIVSINWNTVGLILSLEQGPLIIIKYVDGAFNFNAIARNYVKSERTDKAVKLLLSWDFNDRAFVVLQTVTIHLLRKPLTEEIAKQLQDALGSFHSPPIQLTSEIKYKYGRQVMSLTRRFFHQLIRSNMFETAFLLAVNVGHHDLFMDLFYIAVKIGETELAAAARAQASALVSWCSSDVSNCSRSSCSQCSNDDCDDEAGVSDDDGNGRCNSSSGSSCNDEKDVLADHNKKLHDPDSSQQISDNNSVLSKMNKKICINYNNTNKHDLMTDFNRPYPTTYKSTENKDLYKYYDLINKKNHPSRATYVKAPQVPANFVNLSEKNSTNIIPPLPFLNSTGIPYVDQQQHHTGLFEMPVGISTNKNFNNSNCITKTPIADRLYNTDSTLILECNNVTYNNNHCSQKKGKGVSTVPPPPPPFIVNNEAENNLVPINNPFRNVKSATTKKQQIQVKFSDIVTAFIVPEVKRPTNLLSQPMGYLAPHITSSQKELAESLPLCHPNDDYLKDFMPAIKQPAKSKNNKNNTKYDNQGQQRQQQETTPKIKVVHFGVV